jgi:hypothetical protein
MLVQGICLVCVLLPAALGSHTVLLFLLQLLLILLWVLLRVRASWEAAEPVILNPDRTGLKLHTVAG